jgi:hypothetical protein
MVVMRLSSFEGASIPPFEARRSMNGCFKYASLGPLLARLPGMNLKTILESSADETPSKQVKPEDVKVKPSPAGRNYKRVEVAGRVFRLSKREFRAGPKYNTYSDFEWLCSERDPETDKMIGNVGDIKRLNKVPAAIAKYCNK